MGFKQNSCLIVICLIIIFELALILNRSVNKFRKKASYQNLQMHKYGIYFYALPNNPFDVLLDTFSCIPDCILVFHSSVLFCLGIYRTM